MPQKFIINNNNLIVGDVLRHAELAVGLIKNETIGGGYWYFDRSMNTIYFYGTSGEFGSITKEEFDNAKKSKKLDNSRVVFSELNDLKEVMEINKYKF